MSSFVVIEPSPFDLTTVGAGLFYFVMRGWGGAVASRRAFMLASGFVLLQIPQIYLALDLSRAVNYLLITIYLIFLGVFVAKIIARYGNAAILAAVLGYSGSLVITFAIVLLDKLHLVNWHSYLYFDEVRVRGLFKDPNVMGPAAIPMLLLALPIFRHLETYGYGKIFCRICASVLIGSACFLIYFSYSRGAWGSVIVGGFAYFLFSAIDKPTIPRAFICVVVAIVGIAFIAAPTMFTTGLMRLDGVDATFSERYAAGALQHYDTDRFAFQAALFSSALDNPEGSGPGQSEIFHRNFLQIQGAGAAHSSYVRVLFENGFLGIALYLCTLLYTVYIGWLCRKSDVIIPGYANALLATFVSLLISGSTVDTIHWRHFWVIAGMIWGMFALARGQQIGTRIVTSAPGSRMMLATRAQK